MTMVVAAFDDLCQAQHAVGDLIDSGFAGNAISVLIRDLRDAAGPASGDGHAQAHQRGAGPAPTRVLAGGPLGASLPMSARDESAVANALLRAGLQPPAARLFAEAVSAGRILVAVHCNEAAVRDARDILDTHAPPEPQPRANVDSQRVTTPMN